MINLIIDTLCTILDNLILYCAFRISLVYLKGGDLI